METSQVVADIPTLSDLFASQKGDLATKATKPTLRDLTLVYSAIV